MPGLIDTREGRSLFGSDPRVYSEIRPPYPQQIFDFLCNTGALHPDTTTLEIGAGTGLATRRLLDLGANPLTVIEPDTRFAPWLEAIVQTYQTEIRCIWQSFEEAELPSSQYDLVAAATSFHWIEPRSGLAKIAEVLKPGGYVALWWHVFGDLDRDDPFHEATRTILQSLPDSPSSVTDSVPFALDVDARLQDFAKAGSFEQPAYQEHRWQLTLSTAQVGALYSTFSSITRLPEAEQRDILRRLMEVADRSFGGTVTRNMVASIYVAQRQ